MQEVLTLMDECSFQLTIVGYNTIMDGLIRYGNFNKAWHVLNSMIKFNIKPDQYTISTLCKGIKGPEHLQYLYDVVDL